jgi:hypothetical protein
MNDRDRSQLSVQALIAGPCVAIAALTFGMPVLFLSTPYIYVSHQSGFVQLGGFAAADIAIRGIQPQLAKGTREGFWLTAMRLQNLHFTLRAALH